MDEICELLSGGYNIGCTKALASGVKRFAIANWTGTSVYTTSADGTITGGTGFNSAYLFNQKKYTGEFRENVSFSQGGSISNTPEIVIKMQGQTQANRNLANDLLYGIYDVFAVTNSGVVVLLRECEASAASADVGVSSTDDNLISITLQASANSLASTVSETFYQSVLI